MPPSNAFFRSSRNRRGSTRTSKRKPGSQAIHRKRRAEAVRLTWFHDMRRFRCSASRWRYAEVLRQQANGSTLFHFRRLQQCCDGCPGSSAAVVAREQAVLSVPRLMVRSTVLDSSLMRSLVRTRSKMGTARDRTAVASASFDLPEMRRKSAARVRRDLRRPPRMPAGARQRERWGFDRARPEPSARSTPLPLPRFLNMELVELASGV